MSVFDYIGLIAFVIFLLIVGIAVISDVIYEVRFGSNNRITRILFYLVISWLVYEGFSWSYYFQLNSTW